MHPTTHDESVRTFIAHVKKHTSEYGVSLTITKFKQINMGYGFGRACGCFDGKIIRIAGKQHDVVESILHEYSHFIQYIHSEDIWIKAMRNDLDKALYNPNVTDKQIGRMLELDKQLELDAEKKAVALIKKWNLPIDVEKYIKGANAYIYFYVYMMKYRRWHKKSPGIMPSILDIMPSRFCKNYDKLPEEYEKLVNRYCI